MKKGLVFKVLPIKTFNQLANDKLRINGDLAHAHVMKE